MTENYVVQAIAALQSGNFIAARDFMRNRRSSSIEVRDYLIRGLAELSLKDWLAAKATFAEACQHFPNEAQLLFNLGTAQENLGDLRNAVTSFERSLRARPDQGDACGNLSNLYCRLGRFDEAETMARRAIELGVPRAQGLNSLGLALMRQNKVPEAAKAFVEALDLEPDNGFVFSNLANLAVDQLAFESAWTFFAQARVVSCDAPIIRHHEGMARLLAGDYELGWLMYESRLDVPGALRITPHCPRYKGEALAGKKLLLLAEQGFGDAIQFCRYAARLKDSGVELTWAVPKNLQRLFSGNVPGKVVSESEPLPHADFYLPILSLPYALKKWHPKDAPPAPYLNPTSLFLALPLGRKIGLVWSGSPTHERDFERSLPLNAFAPLWNKVEARFYAAFTGAGLDQITNEPIARLDKYIKDFADTAALLTQFNALVTVDTAVAHLAGTLGVKTYLLLPYCPDWRWGTEGETTPWYPSMTLLRQTEPGNWSGVIAQLVERLAASA